MVEPPLLFDFGGSSVFQLAVQTLLVESRDPAARGGFVIPEGAPQVKRRRLEESARSGVLSGVTA